MKPLSAIEVYKRYASGARALWWNEAYVAERGTGWYGRPKPPEDPLSILACEPLKKGKLRLYITCGDLLRWGHPRDCWILLSNGSTDSQSKPVFAAPAMGPARRHDPDPYMVCPKCGGPGEDRVRCAVQCTRCGHIWGGF